MSRTLPLLYSLFVGVACFAVAGVASADEGVRAINGTCAASGCWAGDGPGLPVTISKGGGYVLTSDLTSTSYKGTYIQIDASHVQLDFSGFTVGFCLAGGDCSDTPSGSGPAVSTNDSALNVTIRNGTVAGTASHGILIRDYSRVENMTVINSESIGIYAMGRGNIVQNCIVRGAGLHGVYMNAPGANILNHTVILDSAQYGLFGSAYLTFWGNAFSDNNGGAEQIGGAAALKSGGGFENRCGTSPACP